MAKLPTLRELLEAGVHFGHKTSRWHPKMDSYIFGSRSSIHVINLEKTLEKIKKATDYLSKEVKEGKVVVFVGTKKQAQAIVEDAAASCRMPYVTERWLGGTLTNFSTVQRSFKKFQEIKRQIESPEFSEMRNRDKAKLKKAFEKREKLVGGIADLKKAPDILILIGAKDENNALLEAKSKGIKVIGLVDSNTDPTLIDYPIPANDDATKSLELLSQLFAKVINENKMLAKKNDKDKSGQLSTDKSKKK